MATRRKYTAEYQSEAVRLVLQEKLSVPQVARRLEISATLADAILDRIVHNSHRIVLKGGSMRKLKRAAEA
jgi:transposase-like protein